MIYDVLDSLIIRYPNRGTMSRSDEDTLRSLEHIDKPRCFI
jgi:hypothetical protein